MDQVEPASICTWRMLMGENVSTCDSNDFLKGPYFLPESIKNDDYIEIDLMGAYTLTTNNDFNGFFSKPIIFIKE